MARCFILGLLLFKRGIRPPSNFPHLQPANPERTQGLKQRLKMGEEQCHFGYKQLCSFLRTQRIRCYTAYMAVSILEYGDEGLNSVCHVNLA